MVVHVKVRHLGVLVSVLATGPGRGFKSGRGDGFVRAIKVRSAPYFGWEVKPRIPCGKIFTTCKRSFDVSKILNMRNSHSFVHSSYSLQMSLLVELPESSGRRVRRYLQPAL
jgi:hypothetical protein